MQKRRHIASLDKFPYYWTLHLSRKILVINRLLRIHEKRWNAMICLTKREKEKAMLTHSFSLNVDIQWRDNLNPKSSKPENQIPDFFAVESVSLDTSSGLITCCFDLTCRSVNFIAWDSKTADWIVRDWPFFLWTSTQTWFLWTQFHVVNSSQHGGNWVFNSCGQHRLCKIGGICSSLDNFSYNCTFFLWKENRSIKAANLSKPKSVIPQHCKTRRTQCPKRITDILET